MRKLAFMATVAALAISPALAQTTAPNQDMKTTPQAQPAPQGQTTQTPPSASPSTPAPSTTMPADKQVQKSTVPAEKFVNTQTSDQWLASDLIGMKVSGNGDESIGSISDLLVDKEGNIVAAVVGVGGFLGIGQKNVAISFDTFTITQDKDGNPQTRLSMTKQELEKAPDFKSAEETRAAAQRPATPPASKPATPAAPRN